MSTVTLTGQLRNAAGATVVFTPSWSGPAAVTVTLDGTGSFSQALEQTDGTGSAPGVRYWTAVVAGTGFTPFTFNFPLPLALGASLDFRALVSATVPRAPAGTVLETSAFPSRGMEAAPIWYVDQAVSGGYLPLSGGTMTGPLILAGDPATALAAATKQYVDSAAAAAQAADLPLAGGTLTGPLVLAANPSTGLGAATKAYVDTAVALDLPLAGGTLTGPLILAANPTTGLGAATKQYVDSAAAAAQAADLPLAGGTLTGPLVLAANPSTGLGAATKAYVDTAVALDLPLAGGTLTGPLILAANPTTGLGAATKQYVDSAVTRTFPAGFHPADPTSTTSTSLVMMGVGGTCTYTPTGRGLVQVTVTGAYNCLTAATNITVGGRFGTGTAPSNGAAVTGTRWGGAGDPSYAGPSNIAAAKPFSLTDLLTLTAGTTYWFDLALLTTNAADAALVSNLSVVIAELA